MNKKRSLSSIISGCPYYLWAVIFIIVPLCMVAYYAFTDKAGNFTFENLSAISSYFDTFLLSIWLGLIATLICLLIAYPLAYIISKMSPVKQKIMLMLVMLPMWISLLLRTYALMTLIEDTGIINSLLELLNLPKIHIINTQSAVVIGMVYNFLPYMILPLYTIMTRIEKPVLEASQDLGANGFQTFFRVVLPLSVPGIVSGFTMVFVPSVSTFYISQKLGGKMELIGDAIDQAFNRSNNYNVGAAMSLILMVMIIICMVIMNRFSGDDGEEAIVV